MFKWMVLILTVGQNVQVESQECSAVNVSQSSKDILMKLTEPCRYDMWERPDSQNGPTNVTTRIYVYFLGSVEVQQLHFVAHLLIRYRWYDQRLIHNSSMNYQGETDLKNRIWTPHIYIVNEHDSQIMGVNKEDTLITVQPDGMVLYSTRLKVTLLCLMELRKFPFDEQECPLVLESWTYNTSQLVLSWENVSPVVVNSHLQMTEYNLVSMWTNDSEVIYALPEQESYSLSDKIHYFGKFAGTYSLLTVYFQLEREVGHYIMDYYVPSILLVVVSWVSFWLDPNAVPGRTTLGTSTMLTFITLSRNTASSLPKVSYIKATEIWFIVCTGFIFGSLVEFAFVNTIWRRSNNVELKKVNSKHILKSTLTPQLKRRIGSNDNRTSSLPSMISFNANVKKNKSDSNLSVLDSISKDPFPSSSLPAHAFNIEIKPYDIAPEPKRFLTMTPQEIAQWIDQRSRIIFPIAFLIFNCLYWIFVFV